MKINIKHKDKIIAALVSAEGKAVSRCLDYSAVIRAAESAERTLIGAGLAKSEIIGAEVCKDGGAVPKSYKYTAQCTYVRIRRYPSGWFLVDAGRRYAQKKPHGISGGYSIFFPVADAQQADPLRKVLKKQGIDIVNARTAT